MAKKNEDATAVVETVHEPVVNMRFATFAIEGISPLAWTRMLDAKKDNEDGPTFEQRVWRDKFHQIDGYFAIPSIGLRDSIAEGGKDISIGKNSRMKNLIKVSVRPTDSLFATDVKASDVKPEWCDMVMKAGRAGAGSRVKKIVPHVAPGWKIEGSFMVLDDRVTEDKLAQAISRGGLFCGIGALRIQSGGIRGSYKLLRLSLK